MKKLHKYIFKKFIAYFVSIFLIIFIFIAVINLFETANMAVRKSQEISLTNVLMQSPYYLYLITPVITMLSAFMILNYFTSTNEYKAIYSSGYSKSIFLYPLVILSFLVIIFSIITGDYFSTSLYRKTRKELNDFNYSDIYIKKNDLIIGAKQIKEKWILEDVYIEKTPDIMIKADKMIWNDAEKKWFIKNAVIKNNKQITNISFLKPLKFLTDKPQNLIIEKISDPNIYSIFELLNRIKKIESLSLNSDNEKNSVFFKISVLLVNFISVIIAFMFLDSPIIKNRGLCASVSIIISLVIWFIIIITKRAADLDLIKPYMIVLIPHLLFLLISGCILRKDFTTE